MRSLTKVFSAKRRRGIATVVTSAMLLSAVAVMGVVLVAWANSNLFTKQVALEVSFNEKMNKLNEDLLVEHIWFGDDSLIPCTQCIVNVTLNNVGTIGLNVTEIKIVNSTDTFIETITNGGVVPGDDYPFQTTFNWDPNETTDFTITTGRGNIFTAQEVT